MNVPNLVLDNIDALNGLKTKLAQYPEIFLATIIVIAVIVLFIMIVYRYGDSCVGSSVKKCLEIGAFFLLFLVFFVSLLYSSNTQYELDLEKDRAKAAISEAFRDSGYVVPDSAIKIPYVLDGSVQDVRVDVCSTHNSEIIPADSLAYLINENGEVYLFKNGNRLEGTTL